MGIIYISADYHVVERCCYTLPAEAKPRCLFVDFNKINNIKLFYNGQNEND